MANPGRFVPIHILHLAIKYGKRMPDPRKVACVFRYEIPMSRLVKRGAIYVREKKTLEVVVRESQIQSMQTNLQLGQRTELTSIESGFKLVLQILERGVILGNWHFQPVPPDGACFTGHCGFDQSYLGELMRGIECLWLVARKK